MNHNDFINFKTITDSFKKKVLYWSNQLPKLQNAQKQLAIDCDENNYILETAIVYNKALDDVDEKSNIKWIVVADNPGKKEQEKAQNRYLVGKSGQMAQKFFANEMNTDFRKEAIIINKTPIHTPKTIQIKKLIKLYPESKAIFDESQIFMAQMIPKLQLITGAKVWIMGLSEIKPKGLFDAWRLALIDAYSNLSLQEQSKLVNDVYGYNHFSMGSFATDLKKRRKANELTQDAVLRIGAENRLRILPF